ncbi:molybdate ABC transporter substrate-binding protein [Allochromatium tepidum]|uniref:Molybdate-binding periplasmic protein ModA n=1 Tax=Allochromatium tepidum TaxID=553982 RepID=A0ABN6G8Z3_9GAMM|nr:molybdate ABC transporter substrate-binding protein [Allochromatium tepidum]BCU06431.1 molybdate-binding periplasmic protein ModA [Allochromatium tepidum]
MKTLTMALGALALSASTFTTLADEVKVAVAANFTGPMEKIAPAFAQATGHQAVVAYGSTGKFYAQIKNGAPFDILIATDQATPQRLADEGLAVADSQFTYASGTLVLWSTKPGLIDDQGAVLKGDGFRHLAIANPKVAVYGAAAVEVLNKLGLYDRLQPRIVTAENINQAHQFVTTGNAELGFVALSQIFQDGEYAAGSHWIVPAELHAPLKQDAVILKRGKDNPAARALMEFIKGDQARAVILAHGYAL